MATLLGHLVRRKDAWTFRKLWHLFPDLHTELMKPLTETAVHHPIGSHTFKPALEDWALH
eukprot:6266695-Amphidinium_carterae.1